jgi:hypothetical protein
MLSSSLVFLGSSGGRSRGRLLPVKPLVMPHNEKGSRQHMHWTRKFWQSVLMRDRHRTSYWTADFRHKYLIRTGRYYTGKVPESPPPGYLPDVRDGHEYFLDGHPPAPPRETRHLPVIPLTPRVVYEHRVETEDAYFARKRKYRAILTETRDMEFYNWYSRVQRVRGRWCREQNIRSKGIYGPEVDAAEIF